MLQIQPYPFLFTNNLFLILLFLISVRGFIKEKRIKYHSISVGNEDVDAPGLIDISSSFSKFFPTHTHADPTPSTIQQASTATTEATLFPKETQKQPQLFGFCFPWKRKFQNPGISCFKGTTFFLLCFRPTDPKNQNPFFRFL